VCVCVLVYGRTHTQTTWVLDVSPGVGRTPGEPEESRSTKAHYTCEPYRCTQYIWQYICSAAGFDDLGSLLFSFNMSFLLRKIEDVTTISKSVSHFVEHKRMHLESSKQNCYIISLRAIIKAILTWLEFAKKRYRRHIEIQQWNSTSEHIRSNAGTLAIRVGQNQSLWVLWTAEKKGKSQNTLLSFQICRKDFVRHIEAQ